MNIEMINASEKSGIMNRVKYSNQLSENARIADQVAGYSLDITGKVMENAAYGKEDLLSMDDISAKAGLVDVSTNRNYMAVMSNSMSDEDFSELLKEGHNPTHTKVEEAVTNLDKIKAKLAENGTVIRGFNDDLSSEDLKAAGIKEAVDIAKKITPLSDEAMSYMLNQGMDPTISNLYIAEHSSYNDTFSNVGSVIMSGVNTYATAATTEKVWNSISEQAVKIIEEAGLPSDEENLNNAKWLVENQIPLCEENLKTYSELKSLSLPASEETVMAAIDVALEEGFEAKDANLLKTESVYEKAAKIINDFANADDRGDITRRRQLEEIRLSMTVEVNLTLLRKGITIDTENLADLVDKLKAAEVEFYKPLLSDVDEQADDTVVRDRIDLFKETEAAVEYLRNAPAQSVGDIIQTKAEFNLTNLKTVAENITADYSKAEKSYEALMTAPRQDMGDSITKAFRNVDDILKDLDLALSEDNRKAVRIMGYSQIQITKESVEEIRIAANTVSSVIDMMTPAKTLQMIREGHNPLTENLYELEAELRKGNVEDSSEKYSEFLLKLERRGEITEEEKSAYIGMYRLFDKIERRDSRVIGKVLSAGEDLTFKNLLSAYRSGRFGSIDVNVDDEFGLLQDVISKGESITDQIEKGFAQIRNEETPKEYVSDKMSMIQEAATMEAAKDMLEKIEIPVNVENILAANDFAGRDKKTFEKITSKKGNTPVEKEAKTSMMDTARKLVDDFTDKENAQAGYAEFSERISDISKEMMNKAETYIDVNEWSRLHKQIEIAKEMARNDEYEVPVETTEGIISIRLKLKQTEDHEGKVEASFESERYGQIKALFSINENTVSGIVSAKYNGGFDLIKDKEASIREEMEAAGLTIGNISYVKVTGNSESTITGGNATNKRLFEAAKAFLKAMDKGVTEYEG